jgi:hypothetical protein
MNYCVAEMHKQYDNILEISAPYSVAAETAGGLVFYKQLRLNVSAVHKELDRAATDLIVQINAILPQIISIADPYANPKTISETHQREFSLPYLIQLLRGLETNSGGVVHLCPYCSLLLEKYGIVNTEIVSFSAKPYVAVLTEYAQSNRLVFIGGQCIHTKTVNKIFLLHLSNSIL